MTISLDRIKATLRIEDIEGYIEYHGAPDDEYDSEAAEIAIALRLLNEKEGHVTEEKALSVVIPIWMKLFNLDEEEIKKRIPYLRNAVQALLV